MYLDSLYVDACFPITGCASIKHERPMRLYSRKQTKRHSLYRRDQRSSQQDERTHQGLFEGFTKRYDVKVLVYYEFHHTMDDAISREKQLKKWQRSWKTRLMETMNPEWINLYNFETGEIFEGLKDRSRFGR